MNQNSSTPLLFRELPSTSRRSPDAGRTERRRCRRVLTALTVGVTLVMSGCSKSATVKELRIERSEPTKICVEPLSSQCRTTREIERLFSSPDLEILEAAPTPGGQQGALLLSLRTRGIVIRAKWRISGMYPTLLSNFSEPRRTAISYAVQRFFLNDDQVVIPPTMGYCFPLGYYRARVDREANANVGNPECVFGYLSYWLTDVETAKEAQPSTDTGLLGTRYLYSEERFVEDRLYATKLARMNALTFIVEHDDSHGEQFLVSEDPFHVWSIDHSMSLTSTKNPMALFTEDWSKLKVPAFPQDLADKLRAISPSDIEKLEVIETYRRIGERLVPRRYEDGLAKFEAWGADQNERRLIQHKIERLVARLEDGSLETF